MAYSFFSGGSTGLGGLGNITGLGGLASIFGGGSGVPNGFNSWLQYFSTPASQGGLGLGNQSNSLSIDPTLTSDTGNTTNSIPSDPGSLTKILGGIFGATAGPSILQQIIGGLTVTKITTGVYTAPYTVTSKLYPDPLLLEIKGNVDGYDYKGVIQLNRTRV